MNASKIQQAIFWMAVIPTCVAQVQQSIPNSGQHITPLAPTGSTFEPLNPGLPDNPQYLAGQAVTSIVSPDGKTLLVLTSGFNRLRDAQGKIIPADSTEFVFVYDISQQKPVGKQVIRVANTYSGIVFDPSGKVFYVTGGVDDNVHAYSLEDGAWKEQQGSPISLGHNGKGVGLNVKPQAAGVAISRDGSKLVVANYYNDSISLLTEQRGRWSVQSELDLRPGKSDATDRGVPGGEYPLWVAIKGNDTAYVSSLRDREVVVVNVSTATPRVVSRIQVTGQPNRMVLDRAQSLLYAAEDNTDSVAVIDTASNRVLAEISVTAPSGLLPRWKSRFRGNNTNSVTLSADEKQLYVTNGWMNDVAVIRLNADPRRSQVSGLMPTGWYPNSLSFSADGNYMYVVNGKSPTGPNPKFCYGLTKDKQNQCNASNQYNLQLIKAGLQSFPTPTSGALPALTQQVAVNNNFKSALSTADAAKFAFLHAHIKHIIYIIKENRTYDQVLGDLEVGNGDPNLTEFPEAITPNLHKLARNFVTLDNFYDTSEVSYDGWSWSTSARAPDVVEKQAPVNYAGRGLSYDTEGTNRDINIALPTLAERLQANPGTPADPDDLPGTANVAAPDSPEGEHGTGYLWNGALRKGLSVRNYGFFVDLARYRDDAQEGTRSEIPMLLDPARSHTQVAFSANASLQKFTDIYFRGFDNHFPDYYRVKEWERELDTKYSNGGLPNLLLMRLMHDHTGSFGTAILGVNTPELQVADNDYAVGLVAEKVARSRYKDDTLIFAIEDDSQDGGDHVDSHRSIAFVIGPYVKHSAVVSTPYTTLSMLRTMEEILGIGSLNLNDASAKAMADVFDTSQKTWSYAATPSAMLRGTQLPIPHPSGAIPRPTHDAGYWAFATKGMDFSVEDRVDPVAFNRILWQGLMGAKPYPNTSSGRDLSENRKRLLERYGAIFEPRSPPRGSGGEK